MRRFHGPPHLFGTGAVDRKLNANRLLKTRVVKNAWKSGWIMLNRERTHKYRFAGTDESNSHHNPIMKPAHAVCKIAYAGLLLLAGPSIHAQSHTTFKHPSGECVKTDDGRGWVLTVPSGEIFVSKIVGDNDNIGDLKDTLTFPNGQKFASETAKCAPQAPFVSADGALVAIARMPATKTLTLHIYLKGAGGQFKEIEGVNKKVSKLLTAVKVKWPNYDPPQKAAMEALNVLSIANHTLALESVSFLGGKEPKRYPFKVTVARDGSLSLADR